MSSTSLKEIDRLTCELSSRVKTLTLHNLDTFLGTTVALWIQYVDV